MKVKKTIDPWTKEITVWGVIDKDNKIKIWSQGKNLWFKFWKDGYPRSQGQISKPDTIESTLSWFHKEYLEAQERRKNTEYEFQSVYDITVGPTFSMDYAMPAAATSYTINYVDSDSVVGEISSNRNPDTEALDEAFRHMYAEVIEQRERVIETQNQIAARDVMAETRDRLAAISTIAGRVDLITRLHVDGVLSLGEASELLNNTGEGL